MHRLFIVVCCVLMAAGIEGPGPKISVESIEWVTALEELDWAGYQEELRGWHGLPRMSEDGESPDLLASYVARQLESVMENRPITVRVPREVFGVDLRQLEELADLGSVQAQRRFLRADEGAHRLAFDGPESLIPHRTRDEIKTVMAGWSGGLEVSYQVATLRRSQTEPGYWDAEGTIFVSPANAPPGGAYARALELRLVSTGEFEPRTGVRKWLRGSDPARARILLGEPGNGAAGLPESVRVVWSKIEDKLPAEARRALLEERRDKQERVSLLGVSIPSRELSIFGPLLCLALLGLLLSSLKWIRDRWDPDQIYWVALDPSAGRLASLCSTATLLVLPAFALGLLWRRLVLQHQSEQPGGSLESLDWSAFDSFVVSPAHALGLGLSLTVVVLGGFVARKFLA